MNKKLYVGGLPYSTTEDALRAAFSQAGTVVSVAIIKDKFTGRSKGFGFVEMTTEEEVKAAIEMFHGKDFEGRTLTVNEARPMEPRENRPSFGGGGGYGGGAPRGGGYRGGGGGGYRGGGGGGRDQRGGGGHRGGGSSFDQTGGRDW
jgi:RNA recognition motif-containing protein